MITRPTLFILGAGASSGYGFPCGEKLLEEIKILLNRDEHYLEYMWTTINKVNKSLTKEKMREESRVLKDAITDVSSIDDLLARRGDEVAIIGKFIITVAIAQHENESLLKDGWYKYLWNRMYGDVYKENLHDLAKNISIVTFNYDRSFENYFFRSIKKTYGVSDVLVSQVLLNIPVYHVYGQIGYLEWQKKTSSPNDVCFNEYSPKGVLFMGGSNGELIDNNIQKCYHASKCIKTYNEIIDSEQREKIREEVLKAERIYFMGFGYHKQNLDILGPERERIRNKHYEKIAGTMHKLGVAERVQKRNALFQILKNGSLINEESFPNKSIDDFLKDVAFL